MRAMVRVLTARLEAIDRAAAEGRFGLADALVTPDEPAGASFWVTLAFIVLTAGGDGAWAASSVTLRRRWDAALLNYFVALGAGFMLAAAVLEMMPVSAAMTSTGRRSWS